MFAREAPSPDDAFPDEHQEEEPEDEDPAIAFMSPPFSSSSTHSNKNDCPRRGALRESLHLKGNSLAVHEFLFVEDILEYGKETHIEKLEQNLPDVLDTASSLPPEELKYSSRPRLTRGRGSSRRLNQIEKRKACATQAQLWKRASLKEIEPSESKRPSVADSLRQSDSLLSSASASASASPQKTTHVIAAIPEETNWTFDSLDEEFEVVDTVKLPFSLQNDEDDGESWTQNTDDDDNSQEIDVQPAKGLLTRRASQNLYDGEGFEVGEEELFSMYATPQYDPWDEETDREGQSFDFRVIGTSHFDQHAMPHVLSPPNMHALQSALPVARRDETFWLKYSLVRDGASSATFLRNIRASPYTILAMETIDGEVFGAYTSSVWSIQPSFYGGGESFLWRMGQSRVPVADTVLEQAQRETDLDVFPYAFENDFCQLCQSDKVAVGGGTPTTPHTVSTGATYEPQSFGFGIAFDGDSLLDATSSPCITFNSPSLSKVCSDGSKFELMNLEVWALTPCTTLAEAQRMECHRLFLSRNATCSF